MKKVNLKALLFSSVSAATIILSAFPVLAQKATDEGAAAPVLEEVVVTARKKTENLQDAPLAISALSGLQLKRAGIDSFNQVLSTIPNASQSGGIGGSLQGLISIRGISTLVRFVGIETGVGFYVDGVYMGRPENFNQDLIDIKRIEILRGPQGAMFGKNTIAGAINIITRQPSNDLTGSVEAQYGKYNLVNLRGNISGPLVKDKLFGSLSAGYIKHDGYVKNISGIGPDLETADLATFRGKLRLLASENAEFTLSGDGLIDRGKPVFFEVSNISFYNDPSISTPFTVNQNQPNYLHRDIWGLSLTSNINLGPGKWTTIMAYRKSSFDAKLDDDKVPVTYFVDGFGSKVKTASVESRFAGTIGDRMDYVVGAYYFNQKARNLSHFALGDYLTGVPGLEPPIDLTSHVYTESFALFFNTNTKLADRLSLEVGGRFVTEKKDALHIQDDQTGIFGNTSFAITRRDNNFSPTLSLSYKIADDTLLYTRFAQGFKSAGFNTDFVQAGVSNLQVDPEKATSYEAGLKSEFLEKHLRFNLAGFYTSYNNLQLSQIAGAGVSLNNAAKAHIHGIEAEFTALLGQYLDINGSAGYLHATYADFPGCPKPGATPVALTKADCAGNYLNLAPKLTAALNVQFTYPINELGNFVARADWNYRGKVYFEPQNTDRLSGNARSIFNARAGLVFDHWEFFAWVKNLTNKVYVNYADDRSAIFINTTQAYGDPRTFGVTSRLKF